MKQLKNISIQGAYGKPILVDALYKDDNIPKSIVVFCHGYKGFKDWGAWNIMAQEFALNNFCFIKFNFSHNGGTAEQPIDFPDLETFGQNNYTKELGDLGSVLNWIETEFESNPNFNTSKIALMGHSRGGAIVTIKAAEDSRIKSVISLAGVSDFKKRFVTGEALKKWREEGVIYVVNGRTKQNMPHYYQFYEDFSQNEERLTIKRAAAGLQIPHLIIHGDKDSSVAPEEAHNLHGWNPDSILKIVEGADHVFNTKHPWDKDGVSKELSEVVKACVDFLAAK